MKFSVVCCSKCGTFQAITARLSFTCKVCGKRHASVRLLRKFYTSNDAQLISEVVMGLNEGKVKV